MKLIHTSDIHLCSPLTTRLPSSKVRGRRRELMGNFLRLCGEARAKGVSGIIIAGDLFDSERITKRDLDSVISVILGAPDIEFFYLPGNHERGVLADNAVGIANLHVFGKEWTYFKLGNVNIGGRSETSKAMFSEFYSEPCCVNIAVLHGQLTDKSAEGGFIGTRDAVGHGIDYIALGHYHTYSHRALDKRTVAVYSGAPEGRGFDEVGDMGYSLLSISGGEVKSEFVPFAMRRLIERDVDIGGAKATGEVEGLIAPKISDIRSEDLVRVNLIGERELDLRCNTDYLTDKLSPSFYYLEIRDKSRLITRAEDYRYDRSLRGEFIRMCLEDKTLTDTEREKIIHCGLSALAGEAFDD